MIVGPRRGKGVRPGGEQRRKKGPHLFDRGGAQNSILKRNRFRKKIVAGAIVEERGGTASFINLLQCEERKAKQTHPQHSNVKPGKDKGLTPRRWRRGGRNFWPFFLLGEGGVRPTFLPDVAGGGTRAVLANVRREEGGGKRGNLSLPSIVLGKGVYKPEMWATVIF